MTAPADAVALLAATGARTEWMPFSGTQTTLGGWPLTLVRAVHAPWELRIVRVDGDGVCRGVRLTGPALADVELDATRLHQGVDLCTRRGSDDEDHSELRLLVPWDGDITLADTTTGDRAGTSPLASVRDLPCGYPVIVAVRHSTSPPTMPRVEEQRTDADGRPLRIRSTGSSIPEVEPAPAGGGGHAISVTWPDNVREVIQVPPPHPAR